MTTRGITLQAIFTRATTTADGGWRVSFDVSANESKQVLQLSQFRDTLLQLACIPIESADLYTGLELDLDDGSPKD